MARIVGVAAGVAAAGAAEVDVGFSQLDTCVESSAIPTFKGRSEEQAADATTNDINRNGTVLRRFFLIKLPRRLMLPMNIRLVHVGVFLVYFPLESNGSGPVDTFVGLDPIAIADYPMGVSKTRFFNPFLIA